MATGSYWDEVEAVAFCLPARDRDRWRLHAESLFMANHFAPGPLSNPQVFGIGQRRQEELRSTTTDAVLTLNQFKRRHGGTNRRAGYDRQPAPALALQAAGVLQTLPAAHPPPPPLPRARDPLAQLERHRKQQGSRTTNAGYKTPRR